MKNVDGAPVFGCGFSVQVGTQCYKHFRLVDLNNEPASVVADLHSLAYCDVIRYVNVCQEYIRHYSSYTPRIVPSLAH